MSGSKIYGANLSDFSTESDVEQKFLCNLLTQIDPSGLGFSPAEFKTKPNIKKLKIGKGKHQKLYHPDYVVLIEGFPLLVIEAKNP